jgi:hypothetical protein
VLTSPWKIGVLVALLLVVVGFAAGYYVVETYNVELQWLTGNFGKWEIDSFGFFKEVFPLVAGLIILSMISYFAISSAVRRYRHFLDSGQDYRKMIQLAESIDDLTNPAQIAKLRNYPELQSILRNYGDQIRGISEQISEQQDQEDNRSVDLEMEIDTLLQGEQSQDSLVEDRWWTPLYRKIEEHVNESKQTMMQLKKKVHGGKAALGQAALSAGRIAEQMAGTSNEYPEIINAANELASLAKQIGKDADASEEGKSHKSVMKAIVSEMENTLHKLEEGGKVLNEFSEENNGLALNIALMAAKGEAEEHELAQFAEKVRLSADRFNKLSKTFSSMAQGLLGTCYSLKEKLGVGPNGDSSNINEVTRSITSISKVIEERCNQLTERYSYIGGEINDVQDLISKSLKSLSDEEASVEADSEDAASEAGEEEFVIERTGRDEADSEDELVVDHGSIWEAGKDSDIADDLVTSEKHEADSFSLSDVEEQVEDTLESGDGSEAKESPEPVEEPEAEEAEAADIPEPFEEPEIEEAAAADIPEPVEESEIEEAATEEQTIEEEPVSGEASIPQPAEDMEETVYDIPIDSAEDALKEAFAAAGEESSEAEVPPGDAAGAAEQSGEADDWLGKADNQWFKIDIDKDQESGNKGPEEVPVREAEDISVDEVKVEEMEIPDAAEQPEAATEEEDPIYDLFDLGAVEYIEESMTQG